MISHRIGTEREQSLHRALKFRYSGAEGDIEVIRAGYVCDGVSGDGEMIEVQTGSFGPLKKKVPELLRLGPVRIVHPIIVRKSIETRDASGALLRCRKSPRKGTPWDLFKALLYAPELPLLPGLVLELALVDVMEKRILDGKGSWRRKGASISDKSITEYHETMVFNTPGDYRYFLPFKNRETFTVKSLAEKAGIAPEIARKALYVLMRIGVVERVGKAGNAWVYQSMQGHSKKRPRGRGSHAAGCL
ncbi:hypothetical protein LQZ19_17050 [Treponema primitia]|uniref:hypothetical protein n=1 Tax=Treponema primitia TaxID=88058 RepID=UPI0039802D82